MAAAGAVLILHFADEGGVDGVVHLLHHQLVGLYHHRVGHRPRNSGRQKEKNLFRYRWRKRNDRAKRENEAGLTRSS